MSTIRRGSKWVTKYTLDGVQHWVGTFETEGEGQDAERQHRQSLALEKIEGPAETCRSWGDRWLAEFPRPGVETRRQYERAVRVFQDHFDARPIRSVDRLEARSWALKQAKGTVRVVTTMFNEALAYGIVERNVFAGLRIHEQDRVEKVDVPTVEQYEAHVRACQVLGGYGPEFRLMLEVAAWTGIRQGEMFALRWGDVDESGLLHVRQSRKRGGSIGMPKNGRERTVVCPGWIVEKLRQHPPRAGSEFVFHSPEARPLLRGTFGWSWEKVKAAANVDGRSVTELRAERGQKPVRWHDWRHFCASQAMDRGLSPADIAAQLGHLDNGILVAKRYGHPDEELARDRFRMAFEGLSATDGEGAGDRRDRMVGGN